MDLIKNILLINVVVIIFLHSLVPHMHHMEMTFVDHKKAHENANDILDYLGLVFHEGVNYNLENFVSEESGRFKNFDSRDLNLLVNSCYTKNDILYSHENPFLRTLHQNSLTEFIKLSNGLRAPPNFDFYQWFVNV